ncbi:Alcohol dehydrogenase cytochrome c subunit precursor (plasmid) [Ketogulonicigenium robustum]|uniref:Alcohol dehydrogenase cytochrome c subunit n=1 Tax=Ketogulonicigenium robustum TaxID=92947 RepID=A0A1W6P3P3_9RHOB|nr:c-type cytochrome [Ketogulonicigenium robustum]ARO15970.1 Alcohol dehydrogenase cytochrome c subunit precursor [Ketogulonicigenium robustum]
MKKTAFFAMTMLAAPTLAIAQTETAPATPEVIAHGADIVSASCASCHTPRNSAGEQATDPADPTFLGGNDMGGWWAPSLRGGGTAQYGIANWSADDIAEYLATGRNQYAAVGGMMKGVVERSTSTMSPDDLTAIAAFLKSVPADEQTAAAKPGEPESTTARLTAAVDLSLGERLYIDNCGACHFVDGQGGARIFPVLDGASIVNAPVAGGLIETILNGAETPSTEGGPSKNLMPAFGGRLTDEEVAALATFVRQAWTNTADAVTPEDVADLR